MRVVLSVYPALKKMTRHRSDQPALCSPGTRIPAEMDPGQAVGGGGVEFHLLPWISSALSSARSLFQRRVARSLARDGRQIPVTGASV